MRLPFSRARSVATLAVLLVVGGSLLMVRAANQPAPTFSEIAGGSVPLGTRVRVFGTVESSAAGSLVLTPLEASSAALPVTLVDVEVRIAPGRTAVVEGVVSEGPAIVDATAQSPSGPGKYRAATTE